MRAEIILEFELEDGESIDLDVLVEMIEKYFEGHIQESIDKADIDDPIEIMHHKIIPPNTYRKFPGDGIEIIFYVNSEEKGIGHTITNHLSEEWLNHVPEIDNVSISGTTTRIQTKVEEPDIERKEEPKN